MRKKVLLILFNYLLVNFLGAQVTEKFKPYGFKEEDGYRYLQGFSLEVTAAGLPDKYVYLTAIRGGDQVFVDSAKSVKGSFSFSSSQSPLRGLYRVYLDKEQYFEVILSNELTRLKTTYKDPMEHMTVLYSRENRCYYYYISKMTEYEMPLAELYENPDTDPALLGRMTDSVIRQKNFYGKELMRSFPETFAAKIIKSMHIPERADLKFGEFQKYPDRLSMLKEHAFDFINFGDSELTRSDVFPYAIRYYMDNLVQPQTEENYILACDRVMSLASKNKDVYNFILKQLMESFARVRMDVVYSHLADRYMFQEGCEQSDTTKKTVEERVKLLKMTEVGAPAPPLIFQDATGLKVKLYQLSAKYTVIVFWSVNCTHCKKALPEVKRIFGENLAKGLDIYAVNLDASKTDWLKAVGALNAGWVDVQAPKGTDDPMVKDYAVRVTPKFLLLDKNKRIISKPHNLEELERDINTFVVE